MRTLNILGVRSKHYQRYFYHCIFVLYLMNDKLNALMTEDSDAISSPGTTVIFLLHRVALGYSCDVSSHGCGARARNRITDRRYRARE